MMAPKVLGGAGTFLLNIVLLRFFSPEQYGAYSLCIAGIMLADGILGASVDLGVLRLAPLWLKENPLRSKAVQQIALYFKVTLIGILFLILALFSAPILHRLFLDEAEASWLFWTAAAILGILTLRSVQTHFQVEGRFRSYGKLELLHILIKFAGVFAALVTDNGSPELILAFFAVAPLAIVLFYFFFSRDKFFAGRKLLSVRLAVEFSRYVKWFFITTGVSGLIAYMPRFLLTLWTDMNEVGIYSAGQTLSMVFPMVGGYLAILFSPKIMTAGQEGKLYPLFITSQKLLILGSVLIFLVFYFNIDWIARVLFPSGYAESKLIFMILLPSALAWLTARPMNITFVLFVRPQFIFIMELASFPFLLVLYYWGIHAHGAAGAAWVTTVTGLMRAGIVQAAAWRWSRNYRHPPSDAAEENQ
ncbi:MAG: oligosaccharide flippase family protein [Acidobacteria bacterium]|nr:oligosaccharide flippase family protein [Acidobacteriota bacterium]